MILSYSLISTLIQAFGYLSYRLLMAGERQQKINRALMLLIYGAALLLPFIMLSHPLHIFPGDSPSGMFEFGQPEGGFKALPENEVRHSITAERVSRIIYGIYIAGVIVVVVQTIFGQLILSRMLRRGERIECDGFKLILVDDDSVSPFSIYNRVVMSRKDYEEAGSMILCHELEHIRLGHCSDLLMAQVVVALQWYNPVAWIMRDELMTIHEYQADEAVILSGVDIPQYQRLLIRKAVGSRFQSLANSLNHSKLKKRITMMYKKETSMKRRIAAFIILPALVAGCAVAEIPAVANVISRFSAPEPAAMISSPAALSESMASTAAVGQKREGEVFTAVEVMAEPPGGMEGLIRYLNENIRYPEEAFKADEQGRVIVKFVVEADGSIADPEIIRGVSPSLDREALRVVSEMPKWTPGKVNGKAVASWFNLPISFKLTEVPSEEKSE